MHISLHTGQAALGSTPVIPRPPVASILPYRVASTGAVLRQVTTLAAIGLISWGATFSCDDDTYGGGGTETGPSYGGKPVRGEGSRGGEMIDPKTGRKPHGHHGNPLNTLATSFSGFERSIPVMLTAVTLASVGGSFRRQSVAA